MTTHQDTHPPSQGATDSQKFRAQVCKYVFQDGPYYRYVLLITPKIRVISYTIYQSEGGAYSAAKRAIAKLEEQYGVS